MRILFLDIDGVLNSQHWYASEAYAVARAAFRPAGITVVGPPTTAAELFACHIDLEPLSLLNACIADLGLSLVLSSSWRTVPAGLEALKRAGPSFIGMTPEHSEGRSREIQEWLDTNGVRDNFAILDDHEDMAHLRPNWIQTYFCSGFSKSEASQLREHFKKPHPQ